MAVVIEDDDDIREVVHAVLEASGLEVYAAGNGVDGVDAVRLHNPDVITLDLGLPDIDGIEVTRRVREFSDAYIVMLTARAREVDTLQGLAVGADDFVTKPFRPRELLARVETLLRRPRGSTLLNGSGGTTTAELPPAGGALSLNAPTASPVKASGQAAEPSGLEHNGLYLDVATRTTRVGTEEVQLTRTEFDLLQALMEAGRVVRSTTGLARWLHAREYETGGYVSESEERAIQVHIANLRRKLGDSAQSPRWVETVRGVGYRLAAKSSEN
ncbi:response regulator transcription factor [Arthrobacter bambusae]|uniref:response regulator transcription factor n=1 Tax=Arthrobacter bambusae TaxID=1338426 RepID=UPI00277D1BBC|nr:response regulator transcription factor [Arthrobacter bambusae]MDQ0032169.1 DNA-binding response OmpR family regulator [Arthrobacter bambusae]MDQ0100295.1 DNA-binding response OmpR family regulator [Arthrobacter bambusae]